MGGTVKDEWLNNKDCGGGELEDVDTWEVFRDDEGDDDIGNHQENARK